MKKLTTKMLCLLLAVLLLSSTVTYAADTNYSTIEKDINVPIKYICESKGGEVSWDAVKKVATYKLQSNILQLKINSRQIVSNGKTKTLENETITAGGRLLLPLSVVNQALGLKLSNDDYLKLIGVKFIDMLKNNQIDEGSALLSEAFSKYLNPTILGMIGVSMKDIAFDEKNISLTKSTVHQNLKIPCIIQQTNLNYIIRFDYTGKIDEIYSSAQQPESLYSKPIYDNSNNYTQEQVSFGAEPWKLPATLTIPKGKGPFPVVILIHGSGPNDRDESVGAVKPFRDIAVGLAAKNIAVLRYEKRTLEHMTKMQLLGNFTMKEEFEQDAFAAAEYLKTVKSIDASNIIALGHSEGGYVLPRILKADKTGIFKAGIIMSGFSRPMYELISEQVEYFMSKGMAGKEQVDFIKAQVKLLQDPSFDPAKPPLGYNLGLSYYYYDMKTYDVLGDTKAITKPMLILQGERDIQVNAKTDFDGWKKALENNIAAEFKLYPKLNHVYTEGEGEGTLEEYNISANIPQYVIDDIGQFVNKAAGK
jgi:uncharacterized protein